MIDLASDDRKYVRQSRKKVLNIICGVSGCLTLVSAFIGIDSTPYAISLVSLATLFFICFGINNLFRSGIEITRYMLTFGTTLWLTYMCVAFSNALGHPNFLIIAIVAVAIFADKMMYRTLVVVLLILLTVFLSTIHRFYPQLFQDPVHSNVIYAMNVITPLVIVTLMCFSVIRQVARSQSTIETQKLQLQESNMFKDKVFSIIGHDLREPFNGVSALLVALDNDLITTEERQEILKELKQSVNVSIHTLDNILRWGAQGYYGSGQEQKARPEKLDVYVLVDAIIEFYLRTAQQKQLGFVNNVLPELFILSDREQTSFIFRNIVSNAIKFSHSGQQITFSSATGNGFVSITITDEGVGMSEEFINSLFSINTHVSREGTSSEKGTGIGLMLCKEFVENNNGKLSISSQTGKGTEVLVQLPAIA